MTLVWKRNIAGPVTHAFVIGVGAYPEAKPGRGHRPELRDVDDIPSADTSAMRFCDWLVDNCDRLFARLATIEMLLGDPAPEAGAYQWRSRPDGAVAPSTSANVRLAGTAWRDRVTARPGDTALFYICGHGATIDDEPIVFLADLNADDIEPWAFINIRRTANAFRQQPHPRAVYFFVDACQEFVPQLSVAETNGGARFIRPFDPFNPFVQNKVAVLTATTHGMLAYEGGTADDPAITLGRYTQTLIDALDGAAVRHRGGQWVVHAGSIAEDLKPLHRLRVDWRDTPFEPNASLTPNEVLPIVAALNPSVPIVILTEPAEAMRLFNLSIYDDASLLTPPIRERLAGDGEEWHVRVAASQREHILRAQGNAQSHDTFFHPSQPIFDQRIQVA